MNKDKKALIVVDMQNDFITGSLGTEEAKAIVSKVIDKIKEYEDNESPILFTQDTHKRNYLETQEGRILPVEHCLYNTDGWCIIPELSNFLQRHRHLRVEKETFGAKELVTISYSRIDLDNFNKIELIGVCTDICVISNALLIKAFYPEIEIIVDASCCAGVTPEKHKAALEVMKSCQITVINEGE